MKARANNGFTTGDDGDDDTAAGASDADADAGAGSADAVTPAAAVTLTCARPSRRCCRTTRRRSRPSSWTRRCPGRSRRRSPVYAGAGTGFGTERGIIEQGSRGGAGSRACTPALSSFDPLCIISATFVRESCVSVA